MYLKVLYIKLKATGYFKALRRKRRGYSYSKKAFKAGLKIKAKMDRVYYLNDFSECVNRPLFRILKNRNNNSITKLLKIQEKNKIKKREKKIKKSSITY